MSRKLRKQQRKSQAAAQSEAKAPEQYFQDLPSHFKPISQKKGVRLLSWVSANQNPAYYYDTRSGKDYKVIYSSYDGAYTAVRLTQSALNLLTVHSDADSVVQKLGQMNESATLAKQWLIGQPLPRTDKCHQILAFLIRFANDSQGQQTVLKELADVARTVFFSPVASSDETSSAFVTQHKSVTPEQVSIEVAKLVTILSQQPGTALPISLVNFIQSLAADVLCRNSTPLALNAEQTDALVSLAIRLDVGRFSDTLNLGHSQLIKEALALLFRLLTEQKMIKPKEEQVNLLRHLYENRHKTGSQAFALWLEHVLEKLQKTLPDCPTLTSEYKYYAHWHKKGFNPLNRLGNAAIILSVAFILVWFCGHFYGEENVKTGTWATPGVTNIVLPFVMYVLFRIYHWTDWRSASYLCIVMIVLTATTGHIRYFQDSKQHFAGVYKEQLLEEGKSVPEDATTASLFQAFLNSRLPGSSGIMFLDHLRFRAMVGTWSVEKAYLYGPYIEVHRQGFNVWFNWVIQMVVVWITCGFAFIFAKYPAKSWKMKKAERLDKE
ncbi:MAG: hypothetical protein ACFHVJ_02525 [Aestuariibacter sp.]